MNKLGSEFLKEFDQYERPVWGLTKRLWVLILGIIIAGGSITIVTIAGFSDIFGYLIAIFIMPPFVIYGMGFDEALKEKIIFYFKIQKRSYMTELEEGEELDVEDFKRWKKVKEYECGRPTEESTIASRDEAVNAKHDLVYESIRKWINAYRKR